MFIWSYSGLKTVKISAAKVPDRSDKVLDCENIYPRGIQKERCGELRKVLSENITYEGKKTKKTAKKWNIQGFCSKDHSTSRNDEHESKVCFRQHRQARS